jgi:O-methyltransferase involved in polyketide biosynthesis
MNSPTTSYDSVVPTGWLTAYGRSFSDIPYAPEVFAALDTLRNKGDSADLLQKMKNTELAPKFEARYKIIDKLVKQTGATQILEVAAGLSTRGLSMAVDPAVTYVEVDLPLMMADKRTIVRTLEEQGVIPQRPNLYFEDGNAMELHDLQHAARHFNPDRPIAILTEGLLRYLTLAEQAVYTDHVVHLLKQYGGIWITPDISIQNNPQGDGTTAARRGLIASVTGKDVSHNRFHTMAETTHFFESKGLRITQHLFQEVADTLTTPASLNLTNEQVKKSIGNAVVFVMELAE